MQELKKIAKELKMRKPKGNKRKKITWVNALIKHMSKDKFNM